MYKVKINDHEYAVAPETGDAHNGIINEETYTIDLVKVDDYNLHVIRNNKSYNVEIVSFDKSSKAITLRINGRKYTLQVRDRFDQLLSELGMDQMTHKAMTDLKAPMPGMVLRVDVTPGQAIQKGDAILVLEAMKMENVIKAAAEGTVKSIEATVGKAVEKNEILVKFE